MEYITEYRVMFNCYDGKGDQEYLITNSPLEAVEAKVFIQTSLTNEKGLAWLECREVSSWKKAVLK